MSLFLIVRLSVVRLIPRLSFLYQAIECPEEFVAHGHSVAHHVEAPACLYRLEVRAQRAVVAARHGDILPVEHARVAFPFVNYHIMIIISQ